MNQYINPMMQQNPYLQRNSSFYPPQSQPNNGITWVQGIEGAKAWQLLPNSNIILMDSENDGRFYIKIADAVGMSTLRVFEYREITNQPAQPQQIDMSEYVKKSELEQLLNKMLGGEVKDEQSISTIK